MIAKLLLAVVIAFGLSACQFVSHQPPLTWHQVEYPLEPCDATKLQQARRELTKTTEDIEFSKSWVCVTRPEKDEERNEETAKGRESIALASSAEKELRDLVEAPFLPSKPPSAPRLGISLAGGGVKAGAFGTGVLAGLADADLVDKADYISSVSGGSYAAYFYFSHRALPLVRDEPPRTVADTKSLYWDCVRRPVAGLMKEELRAALGRIGACEQDTLLPTSEYKGTLPTPTHQAFLRCQQDVFNPGVCNPDEGVGRILDSVSPLTLTGTAAAIPVNWVSAILFDWGLNVSQVAHTYRRGIGLAYGTTLTGPGPVSEGAEEKYPCAPESDAKMTGYALDCNRGRFLTGHRGMTYQDLRVAMLKSKAAGNPMPFWIVNATSPRYRSAVAWIAPPVDDISNSDMFEMTPVSQGSGRWGYVPAPMSLHRMNVMDAVAASAAFADSSEIAITKTVRRGLLGITLRVLNFDWGTDIVNYNVSDWRRNLHKSLPFPLYWTDSAIDRTFGPASNDKEREDRQHTAYIRLIDGGNADNLGLYPLLKREVRNIVIADSASDADGRFEDLCAFRKRLGNSPNGYPKEIYIPGLADFQEHCNRLLSGTEEGYPVREWKFSFPVLAGCLRVEENADKNRQCEQLGDRDVRVLIVKPAIDLQKIFMEQTEEVAGRPTRERRVLDCWHSGHAGEMFTETSPLMNCETTAFLIANWKDGKGACQTFPQHPTGFTTLNSSAAIFSAYRELGRQYLAIASDVIKDMAKNSRESSGKFDQVAAKQREQQLAIGHTRAQGELGAAPMSTECDPGAIKNWKRS